MQYKHLIVICFLCTMACVSAQQPAELAFKDYEVNRTLKQDSSVLLFLQPYADTLHKAMRTVIGFSTNTWYKKQPESALGNWMADCLKVKAAEAFHSPVDVSLVNYGGIRSYLPKGDIQLAAIYELMPFDNAIVLQKVSGNVLHQLLDRAAYEGGWPCAGISMTIKDRAASDIRINDKPLNEDSIYTMAITDYLANGGDRCTMLKNIAQQNINYLYRDALVDYVKDFTKAGKPLSVNIENRVVNVN